MCNFHHFFPYGSAETLPLLLRSFKRHAPEHSSRTRALPTAFPP